MPHGFNPNSKISELIEYHATTRPDAEALVFEDRRMRWAEFNQRVSHVANGIIAAGVKRGEKVAILADNSPEYFITQFASARAGACVVPLSGMADTRSLKAMLEDCGAKLFFASQRTLAQADEARAGNPLLPAERCIAIDAATSAWVDFDTWSQAQATTHPRIEVDLADPYNLIYSSGTTGVPKGILQSHRARIAYWATRDAWLFGNSTRMILSTPLYSNTTQFALLPTVAWGGTVILLRKSDTGQYLRLAQQECATHTVQVPVQYRRLKDFPDFRSYDLSSFLWKFSSTAHLSADLKRWLVTEWPGKLTDVYGMTEGGVACFLHVHERQDKLHTIGIPAAGAGFRIVDENMKEVPRGEVGELIGRSPTMMDGYYNRPEETARARWTDSEGNVWQRSGDLGRMDEEGFVVLLDRSKDMIISGGFNIYSSDLEAVLSQHADVQDCAVIGVPSAQWGETPLALVVRVSGAASSTQDIMDWANAKLGKLQRMSRMEFRDELPRNAIGKLLKRTLREPYWQDSEKRIA